jgi:hypothetical protein
MIVDIMEIILILVLILIFILVSPPSPELNTNSKAICFSPPDRITEFPVGIYYLLWVTAQIPPPALLIVDLTKNIIEVPFPHLTSEFPIY